MSLGSDRRLDDSIAEGLVREYLFRHKLSDTLAGGFATSQNSKFAPTPDHLT